MGKLRVALFCSVSTPQQATVDKDSLPSQERDGRTWAESVDGEIVAVYRVPGHSRKYILFEGAARDVPVYAELRADCEGKLFDVLWCRGRDRLGRTDCLIATIEALVTEAGAQVFSAAMPTPLGQSSEASSLFLAAIERAGAQHENIQRLSRTLVGIRARTLRGLHPAVWPHGYRPVPGPEGSAVGAEFASGEIEAVQEATRLFLNGIGYFRIVQALNASPWRPRRAACWRYASVRQMMLSDVYAGLVGYGDAKTAEPSELFPALWDVSTYQRILEERTRRRHGGSPPASPVSGCVICARCEHPLSTMKPPKQARFFRCRTHQERSITGLDCHYNYIREDVVIAFIEADLRLDTPEGLDALLARHAPTHSRLAADLEAAQKQYSAILERQERMWRAVSDGTLPDGPARRKVSVELEAQEKAAKERVEALQAQTVRLPDVEEVRQRYVELTASQDLRSEPIEVVRARLQHAGVKVFVEEGKIVALVYGQYDYHCPHDIGH